LWDGEFEGTGCVNPSVSGWLDLITKIYGEKLSGSLVTQKGAEKMVFETRKSCCLAKESLEDGKRVCYGLMERKRGFESQGRGITLGSIGSLHRLIALWREAFTLNTGESRDYCNYLYIIKGPYDQERNQWITEADRPSWDF
jgi:hypothetical protein